MKWNYDFSIQILSRGWDVEQSEKWIVEWEFLTSRSNTESVAGPHGGMEPVSVDILDTPEIENWKKI